MNELPKSWVRTEIVDVLQLQGNGKELQQGWSPRCNPEPSLSDDEWGVLKTSAIQAGAFLPEYNKLLPEHLEPRPHIEVQSGDILMTCAGPRNRCGVPCLVTKTPQKLMMSGKMYRFRGIDSLMDSRFIMNLLLSRESQHLIDRMKTGINDSGLNLTHDRFKKLSFPLAPLNEQRRIVAKIEELFSELDKGIVALKAARTQLKVYRQALLKHAFEGKLTADWREANKEKIESADDLLTRIKTEREARYQQQLIEWKQAVNKWETEGKDGKKPAKPNVPNNVRSIIASGSAQRLEELPYGWKWFHISDLCDVVRGGSPRPAGDKRYYHGNIPFLKVADITRDPSPYLDTYTYTIKKAGLLKTRFVAAKTLMLSNSGATLGVPKICLIDATFNDGIAAFLGLNEEMLLYHYYYWQSRTLHLRNVNQGAAQPNLNTSIIGEACIPICSTIEMLLIVERLETQLSIISEMEADISAQINKSEGLRLSILKEAFSGQLVPQDPTDETASELLIRIKAEKAAQVKTKKPPKRKIAS